MGWKLPSRLPLCLFPRDVVRSVKQVPKSQFFQSKMAKDGQALWRIHRGKKFKRKDSATNGISGSRLQRPRNSPGRGGGTRSPRRRNESSGKTRKASFRSWWRHLDKLPLVAFLPALLRHVSSERAKLGYHRRALCKLSGHDPLPIRAGRRAGICFARHRCKV